MIFAPVFTVCLALFSSLLVRAECQAPAICPCQMEELLEDSQPVMGVPEKPSPVESALHTLNQQHFKQKVVIKRKCHLKTQKVTRTIQAVSTAFVTPTPNRIVYVKRKLIAKQMHTVTVTTPVWIGTLTATTCLNPATVRTTFSVPTATSVSQIWHTTGPIGCISATPVTIQIETVIEDEGC
jgi:hypothetical protein